MLDFILASLPDLVSWLGPAIVGLLTVPLWGKIKGFREWIGRINAPFQRLIVIVLAGAITWIGGQLGLALPGEIALWEPDTVSALLAAAIAFGAHAGDKKREAPADV